MFLFSLWSIILISTFASYPSSLVVSSSVPSSISMHLFLCLPYLLLSFLLILFVSPIFLILPFLFYTCRRSIPSLHSSTFLPTSLFFFFFFVWSCIMYSVSVTTTAITWYHLFIYQCPSFIPSSTYAYNDTHMHAFIYTVSPYIGTEMYTENPYIKPIRTHNPCTTFLWLSMISLFHRHTLLFWLDGIYRQQLLGIELDLIIEEGSNLSPYVCSVLPAATNTIMMYVCICRSPWPTCLPIPILTVPPPLTCLLTHFLTTSPIYLPIHPLTVTRMASN